jgi:EAL domain-containing protein (putative c-di-GMP-specific phosphodiesterase class I)
VRDQYELLSAFAAMVRPLGVRFGLERAGQAIHRAPRLYQVGLDYVKLDSALLRGVAHDESGRSFVCASVALLRSLRVLVFAQGIDDEADARALWDCGVDAITGPWASARARDAI